MFEGLRQTYDGPVVLAQDLMVINVTPEQIVSRMAATNLLHWTPPPPPDAPRGTMGAKSEAKIPQWLVDSVIPPLK